jgi:hypothetical protein
MSGVGQLGKNPWQAYSNSKTQDVKEVAQLQEKIGGGELSSSSPPKKIFRQLSPQRTVARISHSQVRDRSSCAAPSSSCSLVPGSYTSSTEVDPEDVKSHSSKNRGGDLKSPPIGDLVAASLPLEGCSRFATTNPNDYHESSSRGV